MPTTYDGICLGRTLGRPICLTYIGGVVHGRRYLSRGMWRLSGMGKIVGQGKRFRVPNFELLFWARYGIWNMESGGAIGYGKIRLG